MLLFDRSAIVVFGFISILFVRSLFVNYKNFRCVPCLTLSYLAALHHSVPNHTIAYQPDSGRGFRSSASYSSTPDPSAGLLGAKDWAHVHVLELELNLGDAL